MKNLVQEEGRYFEQYHPGKFLTQKLLCQKLREFDEKYQIETEEANPMTIRLLVTHDYLNKIENQRKIVQYIVYKDSHYVPKVSAAPSYDVMILNGQILTTLSSENREQKNKFNLVDVHKTLFGYFSNIGSSLDRVAFEIAKLYELKNKNIYWRTFFSENPNSKISHKIEKIRKDLFPCVANATSIDWAIDCRHRLVHDGIIKFQIYNGSILLPDNPNQQTNFTLEMGNRCVTVFWEIVETINKIYGTLYKKILSEGLPLKI